MNETECPAKDKHTPDPEGYIEWHKWAQEMNKTHKQIRCPECGLYAIWVERDAQERTP